MVESTLNAASNRPVGTDTGAARRSHGSPVAGAGGDIVPSAGNEPPANPSRAALSLAVEQINRYLADSKRDLVFRVDEGSGRTVIKVINPETSEVIREIPPAETLVLARYGGRILDTLA